MTKCGRKCRSKRVSWATWTSGSKSYWMIASFINKWWNLNDYHLHTTLNVFCRRPLQLVCAPSNLCNHSCNLYAVKWWHHPNKQVLPVDFEHYRSTCFHFWLAWSALKCFFAQKCLHHTDLTYPLLIISTMLVMHLLIDLFSEKLWLHHIL